jgi:hypothetical protein
MKKNDIEYLSDETDLVQDCASNRGEYISDAISETADNAIDIYNADLLDWAAHNSDYIDEAAQSGLVDMQNTDNIMIKLAQAGQYEYYTQQLYKDKAAIVLNYAFDRLESDEMPDELAERLQDEADNIDRFSEIDDIIAEYKAENEPEANE